MDSDSVTLNQRPRKLSSDQYEMGRRRIVDRFVDKEGVASIYDYGTVKHPGISDLDIMLVFESGRAPSWLPDLSTSFDPLVDELVGHGNIIFIDRNTFERLHYIDPKLEPRHLAGEEIDRDQIDQEIATYRDHASVVDWLPERIYQIQRLRETNEIPVMRTLQLLKSFGYSLRLVDELLGFDPGVAFADRISELRGTWFERDKRARKAALLETIVDGSEIGRDALTTWFNSRPNAVFEGVDDELTTAPGALSYFGGLVYATGEPGLDRRRDWTEVTIPSDWFDHFRAYSAHDSQLGDLIARSFVSKRSTPTVLTAGYVEFLETKLDVCSANFSWVRTVGLDSGAFRFGFLLGKSEWSTEEFDQLQDRLNTVLQG